MNTRKVGILLLLFLAWSHFQDGGIIPTPDTVPFPTDSLKVLVVRETGKEYPVTIETQLFSQDWRDAAGDGNWRLLDLNTEIKDEEDWVKAAMKVERGDLPWVVISNGKAGYSGSLPESLVKKVEEYK